MPKAAATPVSSRRMHVGWFCAAFSALASLPTPAATAATPDPALRRSEQLDTRRIGKVSEDERAVLRVEWRAGLSGVEEAQNVQEMLDSLRRMEGTVAEISRLIRSIPTQTSVPAQTSTPAKRAVVAPGAAEPPDSDNHDLRLWLANIAAGSLVALWWFRRRKPARYPEASPEAASGTAPEAETPVTEPLTIAPAMAPPVENGPGIAPITAAPEIAPAVAAPKHAPVAPAANPAGEAPRVEPRIASKAIETAPAPAAVPAVEPEPPRKPEEVKPAPPQPAAEAPVTDFSLEEADPAAVARENARAQRPRKNVYPAVPESTPETNVEPTLQLAEIMLSMGLDQGAAQALLEYTEANPRQAVYHWLKLLGIYRKRGQQAEFVETAEKLRKHFNVQAEEWVRADTGETPTLEKFSRVAEQVQKTWLQPAECISYLRHLLEDNRDGARAGFPQAVAEEFLLLIEILKETSGVGQSVGL